MIAIIEKVYQFLWGDWIVLPLPGGSSFRFSLLVLILIPAGIWFTIRTRFLPIRLFPDMLHTLFEKKGKAEGESHNSTLSALQTLIVSTATRVGMGNLVGVVAAISAGGAGAVFWMWVTALIGSSTAFVEATLAQIYKEKDPVYGGYRGGPAYYMHRFIQEKRGGKKKRYVGISVLFAMSGLICWCGISQVISNSVTSAFHNAFHIPPIYTTVVLVALAAVIIFRKTATVKVLDVLVPIMAGCYFLITVILICMNFSALPGVFSRIFEEAFGIRQAVAGGLGTVVMNGVKRGLFSLCGCGSRKQSAGKTWPDPGTGSFYRYNCNLQLYGDDHAFDAGKSDRRGGWYGTFTGGNGLPSGTVWCDFHCSNTLVVQFLYFSRYFILCKIKYIISVWRWNAAAESL